METVQKNLVFIEWLIMLIFIHGAIPYLLYLNPQHILRSEDWLKISQDV